MKRLQSDKTRLQAGFVAIEPSSGAVRAWVGSRDFSTDQYDHVSTAQRQPGSTFKPFVYGAALQDGMSSRQTFADVAVEIPMPDGSVWRPSDARGPSGEQISMRDGLVYSKNTITAQVMREIGTKRVVQLAQKMGVRDSKLTPVPSLALGTSPVTLLEMVTSYATIADQGRYKAPWLVWRITDKDGAVLAEFSRESDVAMKQETAVELIDILRDAVDEGTGQGIRNRFGIDADVAGKTGTTQSNADGWFILMHRQLVAGAWVGFNDPRVHMRSGYWGQGGHNALLVVGDFYRHALRARLIDPSARFPKPPAENIFRNWYDELERQLRKWSGEEEPPSRAPAQRRPPPSEEEPQDESGYADIEEAARDIERGVRKLEELGASIQRRFGGAPERDER
ncbi:MAG TPA: penicillin-binding transpeptidase domain-containing protein, partial [Burkholderiales bacterium]